MFSEEYISDKNHRRGGLNKMPSKDITEGVLIAVDQIYDWRVHMPRLHKDESVAPRQ
jgi:hypothetical protein